MNARSESAVSFGDFAARVAPDWLQFAIFVCKTTSGIDCLFQRILAGALEL